MTKRNKRVLKNWGNVLGMFLSAGISTYEPLPRDNEAHLARAEEKRQRRIERDRGHDWYGAGFNPA